MHEKRIPMRRCVGCYQSKPKSELIRVVKDKQFGKNSITIVIDPSKKLPGRGAYLCNNPSCFKIAKKAKKFEHAFSCQIPQEIYDSLEAEINGNI